MKIPIIIVLIASSSLSPALGATSERCLAGMQKALMEGHFTGPLACLSDNTTFVLVGRTTRDRLSIYDYRYKFRPSGGNVLHGGQKVVVFQGAKYIEQYALSPPPYTTVTATGTIVSLKTEGTKDRVLLDFSRNPPKKVLINGEVEVFMH